MTIFEHAMVGWSLALAVGAQRRHGWQIAGMAAVAAALPDADGASILWGPGAFADVHRVWGHNLLAALVIGALTGASGYLASLSARARRLTAAVLARLAADVKIATEPRCFTWPHLAVWVLVGLLAVLSHLPADLVYNGSSELAPWPVPLLWPFSPEGWQYPLVPWGDMVTTAVLLLEMFALYIWSNRGQLVACATLTAILAYVGLRWLIGGY
jgi:membrane-bound metal-dependent hydrolase YbcI (DUF457 family)